jgi:hypothetical protein
MAHDNSERMRQGYELWSRGEAIFVGAYPSLERAWEAAAAAPG